MRSSIGLGLSKKTGVLAIAAALFLSGCDEPGTTAATPDAPAPSGGGNVNRDVERPDVFGVTENALWDGRPSLGGVWVAYPANIDPERVVIRNIANGKSVIGALFRRERDNPGPRLQLSSDAASALGVIAGSPTEISVIVLRREEVEVEVEEPAVEAEAELAAEEVAQPPETAEVVEAVATPPAPASEAVAPVVTGVGADRIVEEPLEDVSAEGETTEETPVAAAPALSIFAIQKPFIQISTFEEEAHATDLANMLMGEGIAATVQGNNADEPTLWRVITGPYSKRSERNADLRAIKRLGFTDAFTFK